MWSRALHPFSAHCLGCFQPRHLHGSEKLCRKTSFCRAFFFITRFLKSPQGACRLVVVSVSPPPGRCRHCEHASQHHTAHRVAFCIRHGISCRGTSDLAPALTSLILCEDMWSFLFEGDALGARQPLFGLRSSATLRLVLFLSVSASISQLHESPYPVTSGLGFQTCHSSSHCIRRSLSSFRSLLVPS